MANKTREVLTYFEQNTEPISILALAQRLDLSLGVLEGILDYWIRKGELREVYVDANSCQHCNIQKACPFVMSLPHYYERVTTTASEKSCQCQGACI